VIDFIALLDGMAAWSVGANETASIELPTARFRWPDMQRPTPDFTFE
jgi:hypothetical protein